MSTRPDRDAVAVVALVALSLSLALVPTGSLASTAVDQPDATSAGDDPVLAPEELPEADATVTRIEIDENGTARWSVAVRTRLTNESDVDDYEAFQERFRADREAYVDRFERRMTGVVSNAANATGREMTASEFSAETSIQEVPRRWGVVTYSFRWTNFAAVDDGAVVAGDVFEGGLYLDDDDYLEVAPPDGYAPTETSPPPDETEGTTVVWNGPDEFADREPTVRFEPGASRTASETAESSRVTAPVLVGVAVLVIAAVGFVAVSDSRTARRLRSRLPVPPGPSSDSTGSAAPSSDGPATAGESARRETAAESDHADDSDADPPLDADLLTDEDRVRRLLERNGGRMRQAAIAEELEWSASKTSRVVSDMADDGAVEKLRIGRENVIDLLEEPD